MRLPSAVSGEAVIADGGGLLVLGGLDSVGVSTGGALRVLPRQGVTQPAGSLAQPLHDLAAASLGGRLIVFGGGSASTTDQVEELRRGGRGRVVGRLPVPRSDLSVAAERGRAYVAGGYDGTAPVGAVLETTDGRRFQRIAELPVPVRYAAVAVLGQTLWVLGGERADGSDSGAIQRIALPGGRAAIVGRLPAPLSHAAVAWLGGRLFLLGGRLDGSTTDRVLRFDPGRAEAVPAGRLPSPVQNGAAAAVGGTVYLVGGLSPAGTPLSAVVGLRPVPGA